jgi:hypothetical protein
MQKDLAKPNSPFSLAILPTINQTRLIFGEKERNAVKCMQCGYHMLGMRDIMFSRSSGDCAGFTEKLYAAFSNIRGGGILSLPFLCWILEQLMIERSSPPFSSGVRFRGRQENGLSIVMKESRARLLQWRCTRLRIKHIDVLGLSGVCSVNFLFGVTTQNSTHWLVLCPCTAILNCRKRSWRGDEHALSVCGRVCFVENVFRWGERPYLDLSVGKWGMGEEINEPP